jgi:hypothetical protein
VSVFAVRLTLPLPQAILGAGHRFKMVRSHAERIPTQVVDLMARGDRLAKQFVRDDVRALPDLTWQHVDAVGLCRRAATTA